jgi:uncharacterized protein (DUF1501 family)
MPGPDPLDALLRPTRRRLLATAASFVAWAQMPRLALAGTADPRLIVVILRGAMDGLAAVPPVGDADYAALRGALALGAPGRAGVLPLDGFFGLNGAMPMLHALYERGQALFVHAAATPYRERSHFDGQDVLESGMPGPRASDSGWLNRAVASLPAAGAVRPASGVAISPTVPLILRGEAPTFTWTPARFRPVGGDTAARLLDLYRHQDPELAAIFAAGLKVGAMAGGDDAASAAARDAAFRRMVLGAARLVADDEGPRVAALSLDGWDTHAEEGAVAGRLSRSLGALDAALAMLAEELGPVWHKTVVAVVTEFGRTARMNGTNGTDHGTATTALLIGGAVNGGRVAADWPGLKPEALHEERDLRPTTDLRAVLKGVLRDHLGIPERLLATRIFPDSAGVRPTADLIRSL